MYPHMFSLTTTILSLSILWSLAWKGLALWKSARNEEHAWFVVLLFVNTLGILDIVYIFFFAHEDVHLLKSAPAAMKPKPRRKSAPRKRKA